jgi:hypothetical protein
MACCGDLKYPIVHQPGQLRDALARAGKRGMVHLVYQPTGGDMVEHWEHVAWLCIAAGHLILVADEVDGICSAGSPKDANSDYWKKFKRKPALDHIVNFGRHAPIAFVGVSRAPQDVWRRLRGQSGRMLVFSMDDDLEMDALRSRLGRHTEILPGLKKYEYIDWHDDGAVSLGGGKL